VGRLRLVTRPSLIGSPPMPKTMGIVAVAALAATAAARLSAKIVATWRRTSSAARAGRRSYRVYRVVLRSSIATLRPSTVNARLKLPENQRFEIAMAVQPARSFEYPRCSSPAGFHRRSLGGKRGPGGSPLSRPQPPEAVAEGQSLQGTVTRPRSVTEGDDRVCMWRQV
jgi:hypothetical protein